MTIRVALFATTFLGFIYSVVALMSPTKTDVLAGIFVALAGITGWGVMNWIEER